MGKLIKMIWASESNCLFLYGVTKEKELVFRSSKNIKYLQKEKLAFDKEMAYTNMYNFHLSTLIGLPLL